MLKQMLFTMLLAVPVALNGQNLSIRNAGKQLVLKSVNDKGDRNRHQVRTNVHKGTITLRATKPNKVDGKTTTCYFQGSSYINSYDEEVTWASTFVFDHSQNTVKIDNLFGPILEDWLYDDVSITAKTEGNQIIFPVASPYRGDESNTIVGTIDNDYVSLLAGELVNNPDGSQGVNLENELRLYINSDTTEISSNGKVVLLYEVSEDYGEGIIYDYRDGYVLKRLSDEAVSEINTDNIDFGECYYTEKITNYITLSSLGATPVKYSVSFDNPVFTTTQETGTVYIDEPVDIPIIFTPGTPGQYNGTMTINAADSVYKVNITGKALDVPHDFSQLIVEGDKNFFYKWDNISAWPWTSEDTWASNNNDKKQDGDATLTGFYKSEKPTRMTFDYEISAESPDSLIMFVDNDRAFGYTDDVTGSFSYILPKGEHTVRWIFTKENSGSKKDYVSFGNIRFSEATEYEGISPDNSARNFVADGWGIYDKRLRPVSPSGTLTFEVNTEGNESVVDFDVQATELSPLKISADGNAAMTATCDTICHIDLTGTGKHTIKVEFAGSDDSETETRCEQLTSISNIRTFNGYYTEMSSKYILIGDSYFNTESNYTATDGIEGVNCPVDIKITNTGRFFMYNLFPITDLHYRTICGTVNDGMIKIPTLANTNLGTYAAYSDETYMFEGRTGDRWWLVSGDIKGDSKKADYLFTDTLNIEADANYDMLVPQTGFGLWRTYRFNNSGITEFLKEGVRFEKVTENAAIISSTESINFGEPFANTGSLKRKVVFVNKGMTPTDCSVEINGGDGAYTVSPTTFELQPMQSKTVTVTFMPKLVGTHDAELVVYSEGEDCKVKIEGNVKALPDYSSLVNEGKELITSWETSSEYPWLINENEAYSTNTNHDNTTSELTMNFSVPEGKLARLSFDANFAVEPEGDIFHVTVNNVDVVKMDQSRRNLVGTYIMPAGDYKAVFAHIKDYTTLIPSADVSKISNIRIDLIDDKADAAFMHAPRYHYDLIAPLDRATDTYCWIINKGTNPLTITGAEAEKPFSLEVPSTPVAPGDTLAIPVKIQPTAPGLYSSKFIFHTSAGDVTCDYDAQADYVRYLGDFDGATLDFPVCTYYTSYWVYPIYTQSIYFEKDMEGLNGAQITEMTYQTVMEADIDYTSADVNYRIGTTSANEVSENHPEGLTTVYSGEQIDIVNYEQTIKFNEPFTYNGGNLIVAHDMNAREGFDIQVYYYSGPANSGSSGIYLPGTPSFGLMKKTYVPTLRLKYIPKEGTSVQDVTSGQVEKVEYFDITGMRIPSMRKGVNIVLTTYKNGKTTTQKVVVK